MKRNLIVGVGLLLVSSVAFATGGGESNNTNCNGKGNKNSPCQTQPAPSQEQGQAQLQGQVQGQAQGQAQFTNVDTNVTTIVGVSNSSRSASESNSVAIAAGGDSRASATGGNALALGGFATGGDATGGSAVVGDVTNTNTNTAAGGSGGSASASISEGAVNVTIQDGALRGAPVSFSSNYEEPRQAPAVGQGSFAISGCAVAGNAGGSNSTGAAFLGFGYTPSQCYDFMLAQAFQSVGESKAACEVLNHSKAGKRAAKRGVVLPSCEQPPRAAIAPVVPESKMVIVPVVYSRSSTDTNEYVTREQLDRAFKAVVAK